MYLMNDELIREMTKMSHFNESENYGDYKGWGDIKKISSFLIMSCLVPYRELLGEPVIINNAFETEGHSDNSQHYLGSACDSHSKASLLMQGRAMAQVPVSAIGAYLDWKNQGLHCDVRELLGKPKVYWLNGKNLAVLGGVKKGDYIYYTSKKVWLKALNLNLIERNCQ